MKSKLFATLCLAGLLVALVGCNQVNRIYKEDTGDMEAVPGPPPADAVAAQPMPGNEVEFEDSAATDDADAVLSADTDAIEPLPEPEPAPLRTYTIQKNDSFWKIAKAVYGDPMRMKDIQEANPDVDPNKLQIGDEIVLPE